MRSILDRTAVCVVERVSISTVAKFLVHANPTNVLPTAKQEEAKLLYIESRVRERAVAIKAVTGSQRASSRERQ